MAERKKNNYVDKAELYNELKIYYKERKEGKNPQASNFIGKCILEIATNVAKHPRFGRYTEQWKQEMISDGMLNCIAGLKSFNPSKSKNPFGYFTRIIWHAFFHRIKTEKKQNATKHKNHQRLHYFDGIENDEVSNQIISDYEDYLSMQKEKSLTQKDKSVNIKATNKKVKKR